MAEVDTRVISAAGMGDPRDREIAELRAELEQLRQHDKQVTDLSIDQQVDIGRLYLALKGLVDACDRNLGVPNEGGLSDARRRAMGLLAERGA